MLEQKRNVCLFYSGISCFCTSTYTISNGLWSSISITIMKDKCHNCLNFGGLNFDNGLYWCFAEKRYMDDIREKCHLLEEIVPEGAVCTHPKMIECHRGCGHYHCPDCGLTWDDNAGH
jgi:hypothetical protein